MGTQEKKSIFTPPFCPQRKNLIGCMSSHFIGYMHILFLNMVATIFLPQLMHLLQSTPYLFVYWLFFKEFFENLSTIIVTICLGCQPTHVKEKNTSNNFCFVLMVYAWYNGSKWHNLHSIEVHIKSIFFFTWTWLLFYYMPLL